MRWVWLCWLLFSPAAAFALGVPFTLTDQNGASFSSTQLQGKPTLLYFGFTNCPSFCPTTTQTMANIRRLLANDADSVRMVFITVDPQRDTPAVLKTFIDQFDPAVIALTGNAADLAAIWRGYGIYVQPVQQAADKPNAHNIDHTTSILLFDAQHNFVRLLPATMKDAEIIQAVRPLLP